MPALDGKAAVVTGGSRGIGRAVVERLANDGASVVFNYARDRDAATEVERAAERAGTSVHGVRMDLAESGAGERLMEIAEERLGGLDILVNNAAITTELTPLAEVDEEQFDRVMTINSKSVFLTMRYAARRMRDGGRIVNISTANTVRPAAGNAPYAASKGAVEQLAAVAAWELGSRGITVNSVLPGATDTDMLHAVNMEGVVDYLAGLTPLGRVGQPSDVADVVAFLAGPDGRWVTGQSLRAAGGLA